VFLPLGEVRWGYSIRRGDGGEAVDERGERLNRLIEKP